MSRSRKFEWMLQSRGITVDKPEKFNHEKISSELGKSTIIRNKKKDLAQAELSRKYYPYKKRKEAITVSDVCDSQGITSHDLSIDTKTENPVRVRRALYEEQRRRNTQIRSANSFLDDLEIKNASNLFVIDHKNETEVVKNAVQQNGKFADTKYTQQDLIPERSKARNRDRKKKFPQRISIYAGTEGDAIAGSNANSIISGSIIRGRFNRITRESNYGEAGFSETGGDRLHTISSNLARKH